MGIYSYSYDGVDSHRHVRYDSINPLYQNVVSSIPSLALIHRLISFYVLPSSPSQSRQRLQSYFF